MRNFFVAGAAALTSNNDKWTTPKDLYAKLHEEFNFGLDAAALQDSALCDKWFGPDHPDRSRRDALVMDWTKDADGSSIFLNPPYGKDMKLWMKKAHLESCGGGGSCLRSSSSNRYSVVVGLLRPSRN